ncbi:hypothetical protein GCM10011591_26360 [Nocardia camponoti]|uniref:Uncharacterized protein n=1 Tax=Nocardia camponoti TaxID=1616106 RepID=A0A917QJ38_9NOCA|nr:hypothetical protein GCM10011591_26360 [Nocardia camponoti]
MELAADKATPLEETVAALSDPETVARLVASDAELAHGEAVTSDELAHAMAMRRMAANWQAASAVAGQPEPRSIS